MENERIRSEADLSQESRWYHERLGIRCVAALEKKNFKARYVPDREQARSVILETIEEGASIGFGDSVTLDQLDIWQELRKRGGHQIFHPWRMEGRPHYPATLEDPYLVEAIKNCRKALDSDVYLTGVNAITLDGKLVFVDGLGNRVAAVIFGPRRVIVVCGDNKIVPSLDEALNRCKQFAGPMNVKRHFLKHGMEEAPCGETGFCVDCRHPRRQCCYRVIVEWQYAPRIEVIVVGETLGI